MTRETPKRRDKVSAIAEPASIVRIPRSLADRLNAVGAAMSKRACVSLPRPVVARAVLERGLDALERELGIARRVAE
jgi:hypothetical protein